MTTPKLKLIKRPKPLDGSNNFWRVCPRLLQYLPEEACTMGKPNINPKNNKTIEDPECPWWINSPDHNFCFWVYVYDKSSPEGAMPELVQTDLARLFSWSNTKTHFAIKEAMDELIEALKKYEANKLIDDCGDESDTSDLAYISNYDPSDDSFE